MKPGKADERFAANMRRRREGKGISQAELARLMTEEGHEGIHQTTVAQMEKGKRLIRLEEADCIARLLDSNILNMTLGPANILSAVNASRSMYLKARYELRDKVIQYEEAKAELMVAIESAQELLNDAGRLSESDRKKVLDDFSPSDVTERLDEAREQATDSATNVAKEYESEAATAAEKTRLFPTFKTPAEIVGITPPKRDA